jgi:hypothetical protein
MLDEPGIPMTVQTGYAAGYGLVEGEPDLAQEPEVGEWDLGRLLGGGVMVYLALEVLVEVERVLVREHCACSKKGGSLRDER